MNIKSIIAAGIALTLLYGCGRSGAPLKPSEAVAKQAKENKQPKPEAPTPNSKNHDKRFILDGLLD